MDNLVGGSHRIYPLLKETAENQDLEKIRESPIKSLPDLSNKNVF